MPSEELEERQVAPVEQQAVVTQKMILMAEDLVLMGDLDQVAHKYEVTPGYIRGLLQRNKEFQQIMNDFCDSMMQVIRGSVVGHSQEALKVILSIMTDEGVEPKDRLRAAQDILNRAGLAPAKEAKKDTVVNIIFNKDMFNDNEKEVIETTYEVEDKGENQDGGTTD